MSNTICIFSAHFFPHLGGVERYTHQLALKLIQQGYKVTVVASFLSGHPSEEIVDGIQVIRIPVYNLMNGRFPIPRMNRQFREMSAVIKDLKPDYFILNARFYLHSLLGAYIAKREKKPALLIEHGTGHFTFGNKAINKLGEMYEHIITWMIKRMVKNFYGVSKACNEWIKHFNIQASGVIYNGVDPLYKIQHPHDIRKKYGLDADTILITFAGRLIEEKGVLQLQSAFNYLSKSHNNIALIIAGDGPLKVRLESIAQEQTFIVGKLQYDEVMNLLKQTDIFVLPTLFPEGLPTSILEAGLNRCAVVATPKGGTPEVIINEKYGAIVWPLQEESLIQAIELYIKKDQLRIDAGNALHERIISLFSWDQIAKDVSIKLKNIKMKSEGVEHA